ncbi:hypothetical protein J7L06_09600 [Candidatus Bathyarchaeota archaeon]|nr:hypothetical protein [Candidatus Bathyarchaeota archaeon]
MTVKDIVNALQTYGLSQFQAEVYIHLATSGPSGAGVLARRLGVNRMKVYRTLRKLQDIGLVEALSGRPLRFVAEPPEKALNTLINAAKKKVSEMEANRRKVLEALAKIDVSTNGLLEPKFRIHTGRRSIYNLLFTMFGSAKEEILILTTKNELYRLSFSGLDGVLKRRSSKGVRIRILTEVEEQALDIVKAYMKYSSVKHTTLPGKMRFVIVDGKEVLTSISLEDSMSLNTERDVGFWTDSKDYLKAVEAFFDEIWGESLDADLVIESMKTGRVIEEIRVLNSMEDYVDLYVKMISSAKSEVLVLTDDLKEPSLPKFVPIIFKEHKKNGVEVKVLTFINEENLSEAEELSKYVQLKHIEPGSNIRFLVTDRKECLMSFLPLGQTGTVFRQNLWSNFTSHSSFMAEVFTEFWSRAIDADYRFKELKFHQTVRELQEILKGIAENCGWRLELPGRLTGRSGLSQEFGFVVQKTGEPNKTVVADFLRKDVPVMASVIALHVKALDVEADKKLLVCFLEVLGDRLRSLVDSYGIDVISGNDAEEMSLKIVDKLRELER